MPLTLVSIKLTVPDRFCKQDWYYDQKFANFPLDEEEDYITAVDCAYAFLNGNSKLFEGYVWTNDRDDDGNPVYVGGTRLGRGFQIHRHLVTVDAKYIYKEDLYVKD